MSKVLRVEGVSKQYRIYERPGDRLKESLTRGRWKAHREFWALNDVSFDVDSGTTVGIIGPNGSGKSTLLQIITGTLEPTHGNVWHEGRIAALLELGAGFNPEFTGIENIFMNAALMGFGRRETEARLADITRFAEIGDFVYQPVKTYSSGMYVRLAFAIAVSADPQILVVDEALAVGDAVFQHRCLRRIREMQERGATILFVSHDPAAIRALCLRAILLNAGRVEADGKPSDVLNRYQKLIMSRTQAYEENETPDETEDDRFLLTSTDEARAPLTCSFRHGDGSAEVLSVDLLDANRRPVQLIETGEPVMVRLRVRFNRDVEEPVLGILIRDRHGIHIYGTNTEIQQATFGHVRRGEIIEATFSFNCWLASETFSLTVAAHSLDGISFDWIDGVSFFRVMSPVVIEGVANLNASVTTRRLSPRAEAASAESIAASHG
ncbi:MAG TPA: ABC transporter ATP-binding protein [Pyrinomonadaceae bacterium]|jgi:ABC-type polysaccharide/polyol phosphate transport system ATPase subunit|nr:ABC transporter ATP-binding protein [Pyrinomonadaceae bacterium]